MQTGELGGGWVNHNHPMHKHHIAVYLEYLPNDSHADTHSLRTGHTPEEVTSELTESFTSP